MLRWRDRPHHRAAGVTPANLTLQASSDGNLYNDLYGANGEEITIVARPNSTIIIHENWARAIAWLKLRSGTRAHPIDQKTETKFAIAVETAA
ncbi:hypothetical protein [Bradyrhizobium sp. 6(2017)]|uniref:hypothetical protein n=1 Tax=Bradyrhizobium sp. 6(2017) TaxID=1197460 RepID=UPI0013E13C52|nr:hypothetical protein [Bradyrhizobium sp. 6(2017)]QIG93819.1 hypothetical protein G6P99_15850 [Bradyrhizobium sp. 6(2017)]